MNLFSFGRPRRYGLQEHRFLELYRNPRLSPQQICQNLKIGLATFYRYQSELKWPVLRVGLGSGLKPTKTQSELYDILVLHALAAHLDIRLEIVDMELRANRILKALEKNKVDIVMSSLCWTAERAKKFYFSQPYGFWTQPCGRLISIKHSLSVARTSKPVLAVDAGSIHADHAERTLKDRFVIKPFSGGKSALEAVLSAKADATLLHPDWIGITGVNSEALTVDPKWHMYESFTGMIFSADTEIWRKPINLALEQMFDSGEFDKIVAQVGPR